MRVRFLPLVFPALAATLVPLEARAEDRGAGLYGLLDGDFSLVLGAGAGAFASGDDAGAQGSVETRVRFLSMASLVLGGDIRPEPAFVGGVELRPLFLILFFENRFTGDDFTDFVLYGLGLTGGVSASAEGLSLVSGLGTEWPLARTRSEGLFLRTELRGRFAHSTWPHGAEDAIEGQVLVLLQWHAPFDLALVR